MAHHYDDGPDIKETNARIKKIEEEKARLEKEKETLIEKEKIKNLKALELSNQLMKLKHLRDITEKEIISTTLELNKYCTHEKVREEKYNHPGGYLNCAEHWVYYYCELCGVKVDEKVTYGGFG